MHNKNNPIRRRHAGSGLFGMTKEDAEKIIKTKNNGYTEAEKDRLHEIFFNSKRRKGKLK